MDLAECCVIKPEEAVAPLMAPLANTIPRINGEETPENNKKSAKLKQGKLFFQASQPKSSGHKYSVTPTKDPGDNAFNNTSLVTPSKDNTSTTNPDDNTSTTNPGDNTSIAKDPGDNTSTTKDPDDNTFTAEDPDHNTSTTKDPDDKTSTTKDPGDNTSTTKDPGDNTSTTEDPDDKTSIAKDPDDNTSIAKDPGDKTSTAKDPDHNTSTTKDPDDKTSTTKDPGDNTSTAKDPGHNTSTTKDPDDKTSTTKDPDDNTSTTKDFGSNTTTTEDPGHNTLLVTPTISETKELRPSSKPKLTKEQREALKAEKERQKIEMKAKKEMERFKKEQEKRLREEEKKERQMRRQQELKERREIKEREEKERQEKREQELTKRREKKEWEELCKKRKKEQREAEKKKREEEIMRQQEEKRKVELEKEELKKKNKIKFLSYFGKAQNPIKREERIESTILTPFSVKSDMTIAQTPRPGLSDTSEFDHLFKLQNHDPTLSYIQMCKSKAIESRAMESKKEAADNDHDVIIVPEVQHLPKFKLIQFHTNYRPAYYGSWRKTGGTINPRNPFRKDEGLLDYEVDSDDEWEEEEPGESISNSEGEDKEEGDGEDSDDDDDGFFVPHGYLSDDEGECSDGEQHIPGPHDDNLQENKKQKQMAKVKAWEAEFVRKCQPLHPKLVGCLWFNPQPSDQEQKTLSKDEAFLAQFAAIALVPLPISVGESSSENQVPGSCNTGESTRQPVPEEAMPDLIRFIHKNPMGLAKIMKTFRTHWGAKISTSSLPRVPLPWSDLENVDSTPNSSKTSSTPKSSKTPSEYQEYETASGISKRQLEKKIQAIAVKEMRSPINRVVWYVHNRVLKQYGLDQENMVPLAPDGSPTLKPNSECSSPDTVVVGSKRKRSGVKSLIHFLSKSPINSNPQLSGSAKRLKVDQDVATSGSSLEKDSLIIIEKSSSDKILPQPLPKRICLETISSPTGKCSGTAVSNGLHNKGGSQETPMDLSTLNSVSSTTDSATADTGGTQEVIICN